jgi:hypothetical protein
MARSRRARKDRNHVIYCITNTVTLEQYIGITVCVGGVNRSIKIRWQKHVRRALTENRDWTLCRSIREHGAEAHDMMLVEKVRGKSAAHAMEREMIRTLRPELNSL